MTPRPRPGGIRSDAPAPASAHAPLSTGFRLTPAARSPGRDEPQHRPGTASSRGRPLRPTALPGRLRCTVPELGIALGRHAAAVGDRVDGDQDVILVEPDLGVYAVLDGMGGANAGDVAARLASETIVACIRQKRRLRRRWPHVLLERALHAAAVEVFTAAEERLEYRAMGTTVVACLVIELTRVVVGHAGDSRAYLLRDGELAALTRDHTVAQRLVDERVLSSDEMARSPHRHLLTRNLGRGYGVHPDVLEQSLKPGDRLLLCSDGLYGAIPDRAIQGVLGASNTAEQIAHQLVELALRGAASDNISAVVLAVDGGLVHAAKH